MAHGTEWQRSVHEQLVLNYITIINTETTQLHTSSRINRTTTTCTHNNDETTQYSVRLHE